MTAGNHIKQGMQPFSCQIINKFRFERQLCICQHNLLRPLDTADQFRAAAFHLFTDQFMEELYPTFRLELAENGKRLEVWHQPFVDSDINGIAHVAAELISKVQLRNDIRTLVIELFRR